MTVEPSIPIAAKDLPILFAYAGLDVPAERIQSHADTYLTNLALVRSANVPGLGEAIPATAFNASWE
ncbi:MAG: hypothetical protein LBO75_03850 [Bifidobacteriaceae bacterium]|jgi:hypothetical protein|nr:hypothetical protein [Bifidobacteriaceae bacterium]